MVCSTYVPLSKLLQKVTNYYSCGCLIQWTTQTNWHRNKITCLWLILLQEEHVETQYGNIHCILTGTPRSNRPAILTFHDVGLNRKSQLLTPQQNSRNRWDTLNLDTNSKLPKCKLQIQYYQWYLYMQADTVTMHYYYYDVTVCSSAVHYALFIC